MGQKHGANERFLKIIGGVRESQLDFSQRKQPVVFLKITVPKLPKSIKKDDVQF